MSVQKTISVHSVERALAILEYLNEPRRRCSISQLSRFLKIPKSTAHMLILTLARQGYVVRDEEGRNYVARVRFYGAPHLQAANGPFGGQVVPQMHHLMCRTGLTVHLAVGEHGQLTYIQKTSPPAASMDTFIGKRANLHCTASGKVVLAFENEPALRVFLGKGRFTRHTQNTICSANELLAEIRSVRRNGFAVDDEEEEIGTCCVAVPVFTPSRQFVAALEVAGTKFQIQDAGLPRLVALAKDTARELQGAWGTEASGPASVVSDGGRGAPSCVKTAVA